MTRLNHIERSALHRGQYVGYLNGYAVRIIREGKGWRVSGYACQAKEGQVAPYIYADTLKEMDTRMVSNG